jgi:hypothetical protein
MPGSGQAGGDAGGRHGLREVRHCVECLQDMQVVQPLLQKQRSKMQYSHA